MSLVGTRPPTLDEWEKYELHHRARLKHSINYFFKFLIENLIIAIQSASHSRNNLIILCYCLTKFCHILDHKGE